MSTDSLVGQVLATRYKVEAYVDQGALGQIYRAVDTRLEFRQVAIKVLKSGVPEDQVARFRREALLTGGLSSPHLTRCSDFGVLEDGRAWLAMEYLHGQNLGDLLAETSPLPIARALKITDGILAGLEAAHAAGVVHRDLKPGNVFVVTEPGVRDHAKLLDFGFAKVYGGGAPALDVTGDAQIVVGTVRYMAPEQLRGQATDHRADLFSAAVLLFRMLTGALPYETKGGGASMVSAARFRALNLEAPPRQLTEMGSDFATLGGLEAVLNSALCVDPKGRPASAGAMRQALAAAVGGAGAEVVAASPGEGAERWQGGDADALALTPAPAPAPAPEAQPPLGRPHPAVLYGGAVVLLVAAAYFIWRASSG
jgi:serine/threonine-protein kinase